MFSTKISQIGEIKKIYAFLKNELKKQFFGRTIYYSLSKMKLCSEKSKISDFEA